VAAHVIEPAGTSAAVKSPCDQARAGRRILPRNGGAPIGPWLAGPQAQFRIRSATMPTMQGWLSQLAGQQPGARRAISDQPYSPRLFSLCSQIAYHSNTSSSYSRHQRSAQRGPALPQYHISFQGAASGCESWRGDYRDYFEVP